MNSYTSHGIRNKCGEKTTESAELVANEGGTASLEILLLHFILIWDCK